ncbi:unnamed protein product, partial [marine sediment metagenome]
RSERIRSMGKESRAIMEAKTGGNQKIRNPFY